MAFGVPPPSLLREYAVCSSFDPSLDLPTIAPLPDDATPEDRKAHEDAVKDRNRRYMQAVNTGNWPALIKPGESPTFFHFEPIHGSALTWMRGEIERQQLSMDECFELAFRLGLRKIDNFDRQPIKFDKMAGFKVASRDSLASLYAIGQDVGEPMLGRSIVLELGALVFTRAVEGIGPLS